MVEGATGRVGNDRNQRGWGGPAVKGVVVAVEGVVAANGEGEAAANGQGGAAGCGDEVEETECEARKGEAPQQNERMLSKRET